MVDIAVPFFTAVPAVPPPWPGMGGGYTYLAAVSGDVDAAVPFYGGGVAQHLHSGDVIVYEDAEHGFMRDGSENYNEAAATDAWARMLAFFAQHLQEQ